MNYCTACGFKNNNQETKFCPICGEAIHGTNSSPPPAKPMTLKSLLAILGGFFVLTIIVVLLLTHGLLGGNTDGETEETNGYMAEIEASEEDEDEAGGETDVEDVEGIGPDQRAREPGESDEPNPVEPEAGDLVFDEETLFRIRYDARYWFEQFVVADMVDALEDEVITSIQRGEEEFLLGDVLMAWNFAAEIIILENLNLLEEAGLDSDLERDDITYELRVAFGLGDDHIVDSWIEEIDRDTNAFIFQLYDLEAPRTSIYMAISYNEVVGLQIFTLEDIEGVSRSTGEFMFCFVEMDYRGSFYAIEGNRTAFIDAIYDVMVNLTEPMISQRRSLL